MTSSSNGGRRSSVMPSNPGCGMERKIFPMFSRWKTARTPGMRCAAAVSSLVMRPLAMVASTGTAYSIPGKWKSDVYCAKPHTLRGPSTRGVSRPIGERVEASCVVSMFAPAVDLARGCQLERVCEAALGQLDLEPVLALRLGAAQRRFGRLAEGRVVRGLAD